MATISDATGLLQLGVAFLVMLASSSTASGLIVEREVCELETFMAACDVNQVIMLHSVEYGRMRVGRCINAGNEDIGCRVSALDKMDRLCSGRRKCNVSVSSVVASITQRLLTCHGVIRGFLEARYSCVPVSHSVRGDCSNMNQVRIGPNSRRGFIASVITQETSCGSNDHPWLLSVPAGQKIKLTLHDFSVSERFDEPRGPSSCIVYAVINENGSRTSTTCASVKRTSQAYTSQSNEIEIRIRNSHSFFLIEYEATGCPDMRAPKFGWYERMEEVAMLGCNATDKTWRVTCEDQKWDGVIPNCTATGVVESVRSGGVVNVFTGSQWVAIVIILAIAVTLGLVIFLLGLLYLKRKRSRHQHRDASHYSTAGLSVPDYYSANSPHYGKTMSVAASDGCSSTENDYYRTWQLQRHPAGGRPHTCPIGMHTSAHGHPSPYDQHPVLIEHIYESPKFERKEVFPVPAPAETSDMVLYRGPTQYFELDPSARQQQQAQFE